MIIKNILNFPFSSFVRNEMSTQLQALYLYSFQILFFTPIVSLTLLAAL